MTDIATTHPTNDIGYPQGHPFDSAGEQYIIYILTYIHILNYHLYETCPRVSARDEGALQSAPLRYHGAFVQQTYRALCKPDSGRGGDIAVTCITPALVPSGARRGGRAPTWTNHMLRTKKDPLYEEGCEGD